ncbi:MAG: hypothetical protein LLG04_09220 [Parachlamydia sp.]|nr:hypothetical protein [Parachlamydia sp.]
MRQFQLLSGIVVLAILSSGPLVGTEHPAAKPATRVPTEPIEPGQKPIPPFKPHPKKQPTQPPLNSPHLQPAPTLQVLPTIHPF